MTNKVVLLGDVHIGVKNDSQLMANRFELFYSYMFQYMKDNGLDHIVQFGDLFDRRKYINFVSLGKAKEYFFEPIRDNGFHMDVFIGNHDIPYKNTLKYSSPSLVLGEYQDCINLITEPTSLQIGNTTAAVIPWICDDNMKESLDFINTSTDPLCFGHFEMQGFSFDGTGLVCEHGLKRDIFWRFQHVYSGHFHHISTADNITYIGSPAQLTWADYADPRGFFVLDTDTLTTEFIENPYPNFHKLLYDDSIMTLDEIQETDFTQYKDTFIKVIIRERNDMLIYDTIIAKLEAVGASITIVEDHKHKDVVLDENILSEADDINETFKKTADQYHASAPVDKIFNLLVTLHTEAVKEE